MSDPDATWPPSPELLAWRPERYALTSALPVTALRRDGGLPEWLEIPDQLTEEELEELEVPSCTLARIELESTLSDVLFVEALEHPEGGYRIVVVDEYETQFVPAITHTPEPLTLGELLRVLDETTREGEDEEVAGIAHSLREANAAGGESRAELTGFVRIRSEVYPQLEALDRSRAEQWAREEP